MSDKNGTPRVLIADAMSDLAEKVLVARGIAVDVKTGLPASELASLIAGYDGLLVRSATKVTADILAHADRLKVVGRAGIGVDNIDVDAASARNIAVMNTPMGNTVSAGEHAIALMFALLRLVPQGTASMKAGVWDKKNLEGREITGKTLGLVGFGNVGRVVAERAVGLRMRVLAYDPYATDEAIAAHGATRVDLDTLLAESDVLSCHTPLTPDTRHLLDAKAFAKARPGVFVINAARGGIVDEDALLAALESGQVAGAALDVFEQEPPPKDAPLLQHPRVIATPHLGGSTAEAQIAVAEQVAEQVADFLLDGRPRFVINAAALHLAS